MSSKYVVILNALFQDNEINKKEFSGPYNLCRATNDSRDICAKDGLF